MMPKAILLIAALLTAAQVPTQSPAALEGRWQHLQPPDTAGEVLDISIVSGHWRGVMNGLLRMGDEGLYYYVVEVENLTVDSTATITFDIGERPLFSNRPPLSALGGKADAGVDRYRQRFTGRLESGDLVLQCSDPKGGSCPDKTLRFTRMAAGKP